MIGIERVDCVAAACVAADDGSVEHRPIGRSASVTAVGGAGHNVVGKSAGERGDATKLILKGPCIRR